MKTFNLNEAAAFLHLHPHTLEAKARAGDVPGAKPGKCWVFLDVDLADWLRTQYRSTKPEAASQSANIARPYGDSAESAVRKLEKLLAKKPPKRKPRP